MPSSYVIEGFAIMMRPALLYIGCVGVLAGAVAAPEYISSIRMLKESINLYFSVSSTASPKLSTFDATKLAGVKLYELK